MAFDIARTTVGHPDGSDIASTFETWGNGINWSDYDGAFATYTSRLQNQVGYSQFVEGNLTSIIDSVTITSIAGSGDYRTVRATMVSLQAASEGYQGQSCSRWEMEYGMARGGSTWYIDSVRETTGGPNAC